ncbi:hypothetical protein L2089_12010 [Paenibacillus hunanensis]|uniref:hypothetical protein n=1 Tax=Paenibacillus hunanensis TaxID=539262 RepID=UPI0020268FD2|nr:hypothetical protein [Paenibacillus hunanensis]MCL9661415.1 hypothetical protein [Paenibacillus hunanensis]
MNIIPSGYFDAFHMIEQLLSVPLQVIIGNVQGAYGSYADGLELYEPPLFIRIYS